MEGAVMFLAWRIRRLQAKVDIQREHLVRVERIAMQYGQSYYTDLMLKEPLKWLQLNSKLMWLKEKEQ
jgi:hypothetical protein